MMQQKKKKGQPYYQEDANVGSDEEPDLGVNGNGPAQGSDYDDEDGPLWSSEKGPARARAAYTRSLGEVGFRALVQRIKKAYEQTCGGEPPLSVLMPKECEACLVPDPLSVLPFSLKHVLQQASMIGHMQRVSLLPLPPQGVLVELGAGKGYLSGMMVQCCGISRAVLMDRRGCFKHKADRGMRHVELHRITVDIKDYVVAGTPALRHHAGSQPTGPAGITDALVPAASAAPAAPAPAAPPAAPPAPPAPQAPAAESTIAEASKQPCSMNASSSVASPSVASGHPALLVARSDSNSNGHHQQREPGSSQMGSSAMQTHNGDDVRVHDVYLHTTGSGTGGGGGSGSSSTLAGYPPWLAVGKHLCGAATDYGLRCCLSAMASQQADQQQQQQPASPGPSNNGACTNASTGIGTSTSTSTSSCPEKHAPGVHSMLKGMAIATCCHHRCNWRAFVGKQFFLDLGFTAQEFEGMSWMTGWALCGHGAAPGCGSSSKRRGDGSSSDASDTDSEGSGRADQSSYDGYDGDNLGCSNNGRSGNHYGDCSEDDRPVAGRWQDVSEQSATRDWVTGMPQTTSTSYLTSAPEAFFDPARTLPRKERMALGSLCKQLIDRARLHWLEQQGWQAELVAYIQPEVSGENKLLLVKPCKRN